MQMFNEVKPVQSVFMDSKLGKWESKQIKCSKVFE